jgi:hypothetical protein
VLLNILFLGHNAVDLDASVRSEHRNSTVRKFHFLDGASVTINWQLFFQWRGHIQEPNVANDVASMTSIVARFNEMNAADF